MSLFIMANHMLVIYSILYLVGDFLRAFFYRSDTSPDSVGISVLFFFLSIWLVLNSIIYYHAFLQEMDESSQTDEIAATTHSNGGSHPHAHQPPSASSSPRSPTPQTMNTNSDGTHQSNSKRWSYYLKTEIGMAYFLNIVGSVGYFISSLISLFLSFGSSTSEREIDRAALILDSINMIVFFISSILFWRVWWREADEPTTTKRCQHVYNFANLCNTLSSMGYFCFIVWGLNERFVLAREESVHTAVGDYNWYDRELIHVIFEQRSMYFTADIIYLLYSVLLEVGWYTDSLTPSMTTITDGSEMKKEEENVRIHTGAIQLKEIA